MTTPRGPTAGGLVAPTPHPDRIALGVRQPWCELILRGTKTLEIRTRPTEVRGPIYLYSAKKFSDLPELDEVLTRDDVDLNVLPRGLIVGSVEITGCRPATPEDAPAARIPVRELADRFAWELAEPGAVRRPAAAAVPAVRRLVLPVQAGARSRADGV